MLSAVKATILAACAAIVLAVPALSFADAAPNPAADACKAEYVQIGADAFKAKYGATEPYQACIRAHGGTVTTPTPPPPASGPEAACKAEYVKLGADAFKAKYAATEPFGACVRAQSADRDTPTQPASAPAAETAKTLCLAEAKALGKQTFVAKYGKEKLGACVKAALPKARAILTACKESAGSDRDAFKACVAAGLKSRR